MYKKSNKSKIQTTSDPYWFGLLGLYSTRVLLCVCRIVSKDGGRLLDVILLIKLKENVQSTNVDKLFLFCLYIPVFLLN